MMIEQISLQLVTTRYWKPDAQTYVSSQHLTAFRLPQTPTLTLNLPSNPSLIPAPNNFPFFKSPSIGGFYSLIFLLLFYNLPHRKPTHKTFASFLR